MGAGGQSAGRLYLRFTILLLGTAGVLLLLGYYPTRQVGGAAGIQAMWVGCGLNVLASAVAGLPIVFVKTEAEATQFLQAQLSALGIRFAIALLGIVAIVLTKLLEPAPFLVWAAVAHLLLLPADIHHLLQQSKRLGQTTR